MIDESQLQLETLFLKTKNCMFPREMPLLKREKTA